MPWAGSGKTVKAKATPEAAAPSQEEKAKPPVKEAGKLELVDVFIAQNTLRIYLDQPVSISVFNGRGQLVIHLDSEGRLESIPLQGVPTGFLYLTLRSGQNEITKKLIYTGK